MAGDLGVDVANLVGRSDRIRVKVIKIDGERRRIGLSLKQVPATPS